MLLRGLQPFGAGLNRVTPHELEVGVEQICILAFEFEFSTLGNAHRAWCMKCCQRQPQHIVWYADVSIAIAMAVCISTPHCVICRRVKASATTVCVVAYDTALMLNALIDRHLVQALCRQHRTVASRFCSWERVGSSISRCKVVVRMSCALAVVCKML